MVVARLRLSPSRELDLLVPYSNPDMSYNRRMATCRKLEASLFLGFLRQTIATRQIIINYNKLQGGYLWTYYL